MQLAYDGIYTLIDFILKWAINVFDCSYQVSFDGDSQGEVGRSSLSHERDGVDEGDDVGVDPPVVVLEELASGVPEHGEAEHEDGGDDEE